MNNLQNYQIAVLLPCYNEEKTIADTVTSFKKVLPTAKIYVYDNNSTDNTISEAKTSGAIVRTELKQGKGNVVRRMFADIDADIYVLCDGDNTYDAASAPKLINTLIDANYDMVNAARDTQDKEAYRSGHKIGNRIFTHLISLFFGQGSKDILSGYRVFSKKFVKSFPIFSKGFEIETELTVHALQLRLPFTEISTPYYARPEGSNSKLSTYKDGFHISKTIFRLVKEERPLLFFSIAAFFLTCISILFAIPIFSTYATTGLVPKLPTAILCASIIILAFLLFSCGLILDSLAKARKEQKYLAYLNKTTPTQTKPC